jgi:hypothetical protein
MKTNVVIQEMPQKLIYASKTLSLFGCFLTDCCLKPISYLINYFLLWAYYIGHIFFLFLGAKSRTKVK